MYAFIQFEFIKYIRSTPRGTGKQDKKQASNQGSHKRRSIYIRLQKMQ